MKSLERVIFFDGVCGLCNSFVDRVMVWDRRGKFLFTPLQGETAEKLLDREKIESMESFIYLREGRIYQRSSAVLAIFDDLGWPFRVLTVGRWMPNLLRDWLYSVVAKNRYRVFGRRSTCRLPSPEERQRFLP